MTNSLLTIVEKLGSGKVLVQCACGNRKVVSLHNVVRGATRSCGCIRAKQLSERRSSHRMTDSREYRIWCKMKERCYNPKTIGFVHWGGKGIQVCDRWRNSFQNFIDDMGLCPEGMSIDRIDLDGDYTPANCRWATKKEQMNNMSKNVVVEYEGLVDTIAVWADRLGLKYMTLYRRLMIVGEKPPFAFRAVGT